MWGFPSCWLLDTLLAESCSTLAFAANTSNLRLALVSAGRVQLQSCHDDHDETIHASTMHAYTITNFRGPAFVDSMLVWVLQGKYAKLVPTAVHLIQQPFT